MAMKKYKEFIDFGLGEHFGMPPWIFPENPACLRPTV
jgi:hypothetical protein